MTRRWEVQGKRCKRKKGMSPCRNTRLAGRAAAWMVIAALLGGPLAARAQSAVVTRNVHLRAGPSTEHQILRTLHPGDEITVLTPAKTNNYWDVRTAGGEDGWVWSYNVRLVSADAGSPTPDDSMPEIYHGCGLDGTAQYDSRRARNRLKNRRAAPGASDMDSTVTLARMLDGGDGHDRWSDTSGARVVGYVLHVRPGGRETVNCGASALEYRDTHIELVPSAGDTAKVRRVIVEVTPRWRARQDARGTDWSTGHLRDRLEDRCAAFTGWLFFDAEHADEAENTAPGRELNWRATAWEIHPVTAIDTVPCGGAA